jgi:hypothetical protein
MPSNNTDGTDPVAPGQCAAGRDDPGARTGRMAYVPAGREMRPLELGEPADFTTARALDVLVPACDRPAELAAVLSGLAAQTGALAFGVVISDQSTGDPGWCHPAVAAMVRILRRRGHPVLLERHLPRRGLAEQRSFLLGRSAADRVLRADSHRAYEQWPARPYPERVRPGSPGWDRARLHAAANLLHVTEKLRLDPHEWRAYRVAWVGACVLYDRKRLVAAGGFDFWRRVPAAHCGEDVVAQLRVLERDGGAGIVPSGAYHLESPTTVPDRRVNCVDLVLAEGGAAAAEPVRTGVEAS